ncbi:uncharacterized protein LOC144875486 [Branchiostoma floridae x Branchiostoma japonicum]
MYFHLTGVPFDGSPFQLVGTKVYECHLGKDRNAAAKDKYHAQRQAQSLEDHAFQARRCSVQTTKKMNCPVQFTVYHIIKFPDDKFKIDKDTDARRRKASKDLKKAIDQKPSSVQATVQFHTCFPTLTEHKNHPTVGEVAELREGVDERVKGRIRTLALNGVKDIREMRRHLDAYVNDDLFKEQDLPPTTRRRYNPTDKDIRNNMDKSKDRIKNSKEDQCNVQVMCNRLQSYIITVDVKCKILTSRWLSKGDCNIMYRPSQKQTDGSVTTLLYCYQAAWQARLLQKYGNQMCLLDATYRTCRFDLPLFFLCVRTNVCYAVVGFFIITNEAAEDIEEALQVFKDWNSSWTPSHFMVDFSRAEMNALAEVFPGETSKVHLCDFHREKSWVEWVRKGANGVSHEQQTVLKLLRNLAASSTQEEFLSSLSNLQDSDVWNESEKLRDYISHIWLPEAERWVHMFRAKQLKIPVYTNNGIERQNETLKHSFLQGYKKSSLTELITVLVTQFTTNTLRKYTQLNIESSSMYRRYNENIPVYLRDRPRGFVQHMKARLEEAKDYTANDVIELDHDTFSVKSQSEPSKYHTVYFGDDEDMPCCTCRDWARHLLPCKHFFAIFQQVSGWGWENLPASYKDNPLFTLDDSCLGQKADSPSTSASVNVEASNATQLAFIPASLPEKKSSNKRKRDQMRTACGSLLHAITENTYHLQDEEYLQELKDQLTEMLEDVRSHTLHEGPFRISFSPKKKKTSTPPKDKAKTPPEDKAWTPPEDKARTPPEDKARTPPEDKAWTPPEDEAKTPPEDEAKTPPEDKARTPPEDKAWTPPEDKAWTPPEDKARTPQEDKTSTLPKDKTSVRPEDIPFSPPEEAKMAELPVRRGSRKHPYTKRVGLHAEIMRSTFQVKVTVDQDINTIKCEPEPNTPTTRRGGPSAHNILVNGFGYNITYQDMQSLQCQNWVNDRIINFYLKMVVHRGNQQGPMKLASFDTYFYTMLMKHGYMSEIVMQWSRDIDLSSVDLALIPVHHQGNHWCLAVVDTGYMCLRYFDSMGGRNDKGVKAIRCYLQECSKRKGMPSAWAVEYPKEIPRQLNGYDCGVFCCKYAQYTCSQDGIMNFTQDDMPRFRKEMEWEITHKMLL